MIGGKQEIMTSEQKELLTVIMNNKEILEELFKRN